MPGQGDRTERIPLLRKLGPLLITSRAIPDQYVDSVRMRHLDSWARQSFVMVPAGVLVALALVFQQPHALEHGLFLLCLGALVFAYGANLVIAQRWLSSPDQLATMGSTRRWLFIARLTLGIFWAIYLNLVMRSGAPHVATLIVGVEVALVASTVIGGPMTYAFAVWWPLTLGTLASVAYHSPAGSLPIVVCVVIYTLYTLYSILSLNARMIERTLTMLRLEHTNETIRILLRDFEESASDWLWETDAQLCLKHVSPRFAEVAHRPLESMQGKLIDVLFGSAASDSVASQARFLACLEARLPMRDIVVPVQVGPERRWWSLTGKPIFDGPNGDFSGYRGVGSDVTASHQSREHIAFLATHDMLTGLANRVEFNAAVATMLAGLKNSAGAALLTLDLDAFKAVNDVYGHSMGDRVLRAVAHRMRATIRDRDVVARLGGDEFSLLLDTGDEAEVAAVAERIIDRVARPFKFDGVTIEIGTSVGIAIAPRDGATPEELYKNSDSALYRAKAAGRGTWRIFDPRLDRNLRDDPTLQRELRDAVANGGLVVEFQPIIALRSRRVVGVEALVGWHHPERGPIPSETFIAIAEQNGLIGAIGTFVLSEAIDLVRQLPDGCRVCVNISPVQLRDARLVRDVASLLDDAEIDPSSIEFEITESSMLENDGRSHENLRALRLLGCRTALDDFGAGYSSLAKLYDIPFDRLKIGRRFIADLESDAANGSVVRAIIDLAHALDLDVTAEGVSNDVQADLLNEYGCDEAQGPEFFVPLSKEQLLQQLERFFHKTGLAEPDPGRMSAQAPLEEASGSPLDPRA